MVSEADDNEVAEDAIQLLVVACFNGLCRLIAGLSANGFVDADQLDGIHDAMTTPLDDPDWRDDEFVANARDIVSKVLASALVRVKE